MYEDFFGLKKAPFSDKATGSSVFVGPLTAKTMAGFRKALTAQDAVVTVSGVAGTGKTTLVARSVDAFDVRKKIVRVSRVQMNASDVLESLLIVLGVENRPAGTIARFTALRRKMKEFEDAGVRVFVIVEDALRTGADVLAEIEALTAADAGESGGASIVLMGDERLAEFMKDPQLAQLQQRVRQRHSIAPLCAAELRGYLRHCFRLAGGDFDAIFDGKCWELLHHLSGGVPRIANNIVEAALASAAEQGVRPVTAELIAKVAADEFQLSSDDFDFTSDPEPATIEAPAAPADVPVAESPSLPEPEPVVAESAAAPEEPEAAAVPAESEALPIVEAPDEPAPAEEPVLVINDEGGPDADAIPDLIQDTLPDLAVLAPDLAEHAAETEPAAIPELQLENAAELIADDIPELEPIADPEPLPELAIEPEPVTETAVDPEPLPELTIEPEPLPELAIEPEPLPEPAVDPEPLPKLAIEPEPPPEPASEPEPRPELALEPDVATDAEAPAPPATPEAETSGSDEIPDWERDPTLAELKPDLEALEQAMAVAHGTSTPIPDDSDDEPAKSAGNDEPIEEIPEITLDNSIRTGIEKMRTEDTAVELAKRDPEQADAELEKIVAELAKAKTLEDVDDKMAETLFGSEISMIAAQVIGNPPVEEPANDADQPPAELAPMPETTAAPDTTPVAEEVSMESTTPSDTGMDLSASQRLKTVRALNADLHPSLREPENEPATNGGGPSPESIEDQIETSITQTLKALKVPPDVANQDDDEEERGKSGFFSRFKRS